MKLGLLMMTRVNRFFLLAIALFPFFSAKGQHCDCKANLLELINTTKNNYAGFGLLTKKSNDRKYQLLVNQLIKEAPGKNRDGCFILMNRYIRFFRDPHFNLYAHASQQADCVFEPLKNRRTPVNKPERLTGIWQNLIYGNTIQIQIKNGSIVASQKKDTLWKFRAVDTMYTIYPGPGNTFDFIYSMSRNSKYLYHLELKRDTLFYRNRPYYIKLKPGIIVPFREKEEGSAFKIIDEHTSYLKLSSFSYRQKTVIDSLLQQHDSSIIKRKRLIIDLRDNGGGTTAVTYGLIKYWYDKPFKYIEGYTIASDSNIASTEKMLVDYKTEMEPAELKYYTWLLGEMKRHRGELVKDTSRIYYRDSILARPAEVIIFINGGTASAAELLLLAAKKSSKVQVWGKSTYGMTDFGSFLSFSLAGGAYKADIPSEIADHTFNMRFDMVGIPPDVVIPRSAKDWVAYFIEKAKRK